MESLYQFYIFALARVCQFYYIFRDDSSFSLCFNPPQGTLRIIKKIKFNDFVGDDDRSNVMGNVFALKLVP